MPLHFHPSPSQPIRFLPRHGTPTCVLEWVSQETIKMLASVFFYMAVFSSASLLTLYFTVHPFGI